MSTKTLATALPSETIHITTNPVTEPFWQAAKERRLTAAQCDDCGTFSMPPPPCCPESQAHAIGGPALSCAAPLYRLSRVDGFPGPQAHTTGARQKRIR